MSKSQVVRIGLLGNGTVGSAFRALLEDQADHIDRLTGRLPVISGVLTRSSEVDFDWILAHSDIIVELIGGIDPAYSYAQSTIAAGKSLITANKLLIATYGEELYCLAQNQGAQIYFEAAVAGVAPVIRVLQESLEVIRLQRLQGIVNGTTNLILGLMARGMPYDEALQIAQTNGYAEADPTADVTGADAAAKMAILTRLAFGAHIELKQVECAGITEVNVDDVNWCKRYYNYVLKLVGTAERVQNGISVRVHPVFVPTGHPLGDIQNANNAVTIHTAIFRDPISIIGPGAGGIETATAVVGDTISAIRGLPGSMPEAIHRLPMITDYKSAFFLHLHVSDEAGVLVSLAQIMVQHDLSIKQMDQATGPVGQAEIGIVIHPAFKSHFLAAVEQLQTASFVTSTPRYTHVLEN